VPDSDHESSAPDPDQVVEQMREATERLRDHAWVVAAIVSASTTPESTEEQTPAN